MSKRIKFRIEDINSIIEDYRNNILMKEITKKYDCSAKTIRKVLHRENIEVKDRKIGAKWDYKLDFKNIDSEETAYIVGLLGADGAVSDDTDYTVRIGMCDLDIIEKVRNIICPRKPIRVVKKDKPRLDCYVLNINDKTIHTNLRKHNIIPKKSLILEPPPDIPDELIHHWMRGLFDGDGHVTYANKTLIVGITGSKYIINYIYNLVYNKFNMKGYIERIKNSYKIVYRAFNARIFLKYLYRDATLYMDRKWNLAREYIENPLPKTTKRFWSEKDEMVLKEKYPNSSKQELLSIFPYTSWCAIRDRAIRLKIRRKYNWRKNNEREE